MLIIIRSSVVVRRGAGRFGWLAGWLGWAGLDGVALERTRNQEPANAFWVAMLRSSFKRLARRWLGSIS